MPEELCFLSVCSALVFIQILGVFSSKRRGFKACWNVYE